MAHVTEVGHSPHSMSNAEIERVGSYLIDTPADLGLSLEAETVAAPEFFGALEATSEVGSISA